MVLGSSSSSPSLGDTDTVSASTSLSATGWRNGRRAWSSSPSTGGILVGAMCPAVAASPSLLLSSATMPLPWRRNRTSSTSTNLATKTAATNTTTTRSACGAVSRAAVYERLWDCLTSTPHHTQLLQQLQTSDHLNTHQNTPHHHTSPPVSPSSSLLWNSNNMMDPCPCSRGVDCEMCHTRAELLSLPRRYKADACPSTLICHRQDGRVLLDGGHSLLSSERGGGGGVVFDSGGTTTTTSPSSASTTQTTMSSPTGTTNVTDATISTPTTTTTASAPPPPCPCSGSSSCPFYHTVEEKAVWLWVARCTAAAIAAIESAGKMPLPSSSSCSYREGRRRPTDGSSLLSSLILTGSIGRSGDVDGDLGGSEEWVGGVPTAAVPDVRTPYDGGCVREVMCAVRDAILQSEKELLKAAGFVVGGGVRAERGPSPTTVSVHRRSYDDLLTRLKALRSTLCPSETTIHSGSSSTCIKSGGRLLTAAAIASYLQHTHAHCSHTTDQPQHHQFSLPVPPSVPMVNAVLQAAHLLFPHDHTPLLLTVMAEYIGASPCKLRYIDVYVDCIDDATAAAILRPYRPFTAPRHPQRNTGDAGGIDGNRTLGSSIVCLPELDIGYRGTDDDFLSRLIRSIDSIPPHAVATEALVQCWADAARGVHWGGASGRRLSSSGHPYQPPPPQPLEEVAGWLWRALLHQILTSAYPSDAAAALISSILEVQADPSSITATFPLMAASSSRPSCLRGRSVTNTISSLPPTPTCLVGAVSAVLSSVAPPPSSSSPQTIDTHDGANRIETPNLDNPLRWVVVTDSAMVAVTQGWVSYHCSPNKEGEYPPGGEGARREVVVVHMAPLLECLLGV